MFRKFLGGWMGSPSRDDPVFGRLVFRRRPSGLWFGKAVFSPSGAEVALAIDADEVGPGESQHELYRKIESRWNEVRDACADALSRFHRDVLDEDITDVWSAYRLSGIFVPRIESPHMSWQLRFDSTADENHEYVVEFEGWAPTGEVRPEG